MQEFKVEKQLNGTELVLKMSGYLNESAVFEAVNESDCDTLVLDLEGINYINSTGIHSWIKWIYVMAETYADKPMVLRKVSRVMMEQMNNIEDFIPMQATFESIFVPYYCDKCEQEKAILLEIDKDIIIQGGEIKVVKEDIICHDQPMEIDVLPQKYFRALEMRM